MTRENAESAGLNRESRTRPVSGIGRRTLLLGGGAGAGLAVIAGTAGGGSQKPSGAAPDDGSRSPRYAETDHIRAFYARARF